MSERRLRVLAIASHPVQYAAPIFRLLAQQPGLDFQVAYCGMRGAEAGHDPEFGRSVKWDVPLLDGYAWTHVSNRGSGSESFFGLYNPGLWKLIREGSFDAVLSFTGYIRASFWISYLAGKLSRTAFLFGTDASSIEPRDGRKWKRVLKSVAWPLLFRLSSQVLTASSAGKKMMKSFGIPEEQISMTLDTVDNDWWTAESGRVDRAQVRAAWGINPAEKVILFCGKLQPWKRPLDALRAFSIAAIPQSSLIFAGDGDLRSRIEAEASDLGLGKRVHMLGFVNQSQLPGVYRASDMVIVASEYEPFGLVVNEAMLCGCVVVASDKVGAVGDLIIGGQTGFVYPCGDVQALTSILQNTLSNYSGLSIIANAARTQVRTWSPQASVAALVEGIARATYRSRRAGRQCNSRTVGPSKSASI
jgi:glycosyltransferase involved in cell wall biosynthesis